MRRPKQFKGKQGYRDRCDEIYRELIAAGYTGDRAKAVLARLRALKSKHGRAVLEMNGQRIEV